MTSEMDCHEFNKLNSRNDGIGGDSIPSYRLCEGAERLKAISLYRHCEHSPECEAIHRDNPLIENIESQGDFAESLKDSSDSTESSDFNLVDCHDSATAESRNDAPYTLSLRGFAESRSNPLTNSIN